MDKMNSNKDNFSTILLIAGASLVIFYLLKSSKKHFTNTPQNVGVNKRRVNRPVKKSVRENLANIDDPSLLLSKNPGNDLPMQQEPASYPPSKVPASNQKVLLGKISTLIIFAFR